MSAAAAQVDRLCSVTDAGGAYMPMPEHGQLIEGPLFIVLPDDVRICIVSDQELITASQLTERLGQLESACGCAKRALLDATDHCSTGASGGCGGGGHDRGIAVSGTLTAGHIMDSCLLVMDDAKGTDATDAEAVCKLRHKAGYSPQIVHGLLLSMVLQRLGGRFVSKRLMLTNAHPKGLMVAQQITVAALIMDAIMRRLETNAFRPLPPHMPHLTPQPMTCYIDVLGWNQDTRCFEWQKLLSERGLKRMLHAARGIIGS